MSTFNGFGTMYYGWRHQSDGSAFATKWFVAFYLPVIPCARHRLKVVTDLNQKEPFLQLTRYTEYQILDSPPLSAKDIFATYGWTYLIGPVLVAWPGLLFWVFLTIVKAHREWYQSNLGDTFGLVVAFTFGLLIIGNPIAVVLSALRCARGSPTSLLSGRVSKIGKPS